jgi:hypothetical protein
VGRYAEPDVATLMQHMEIDGLLVAPDGPGAAYVETEAEIHVLGLVRGVEHPHHDAVAALGGPYRC